MDTNWQNRIVGYRDVDVSEILFHPLNYRVHPTNQQDALNGVLDKVGVIQNVVINERTGRMLDGHLRATLAERAGQTTIPATIVDLSEDEERLVLATLDRITGLAIQDDQTLAELLAMIPRDDDIDALLALLPSVDAQATGEGVPVEFTAYSDEIATEYQCPSCGYEWSGQAKP